DAAGPTPSKETPHEHHRHPAHRTRPDLGAQRLPRRGHRDPPAHAGHVGGDRRARQPAHRGGVHVPPLLHPQAHLTTPGRRTAALPTTTTLEGPPCTPPPPTTAPGPSAPTDAPTPPTPPAGPAPTSPCTLHTSTPWAP